MSTWLIDTGPLVACLNRSDPHHSACVDALKDFSGHLVTTGAVVTEAMHFLGQHPDGAAALVDLLDESQIEIRDCFSPSILKGAAKLMKKYQDLPMDFADATLVLLAEETGLEQVLTLDRRGFRTYRFRGNRRFSLIPEI